MLKFFVIILVFIELPAFPSHAREKPFENRIFKESIHSVRFFRQGWEFSVPVLDLGRDQHLILMFDDLSEDIKNYSYKITHCDFEWFPSRLIQTEYQEGFADNPITDYSKSINTTIPYIHYSLTLPNENARLLLSGNYILTIFEDGHPENPVLTRRFYVTEPLCRISGLVKKATYDSFKGPNQEVDFTVEYGGLKLQDPKTEIKTVLIQNANPDNAITNLKPLYIRDNQLIYDYSKENVFLGGNEFRNFDIKNLQLNSLRVAAIDFINPLFHVTLLTDEPRNDNYLLENDLNGHYFIKNERASDPELESDYVMAHFSLKAPVDLVEGDLYIYGELSDWQLQHSNKMNYNSRLKLYEGALLLKQGFYDYQYAFVEKNTNKINNVLLEGSHVETENDYQIFVYYRGFSSRYDRLVGFRMINSVKQ